MGQRPIRVCGRVSTIRILHLNELYPPMVLGGAERSVALLAEAQARAGHTVAVVATTPGKATREERGGVTVFRIPHGTLFWSEEWPKHNRFARLWRKFMMPFNRSQRTEWLRVLDNVRPDVVNTHSMNDVSTGLWAATKKTGYPLVHTLRNYDLLCANAALWHDGKPCPARCHVISAAKKRQSLMIDAVASNSAETLRIHTDAGLFENIPAELRRVIWSISATSDAVAHRPVRHGPVVLGYFGRITEEKGIETLLAAVRQLDPATYRLVIGGKLNDVTQRLQSAYADLPVEWLGFVSAAEFFDRVDVLVVPSIWPEPLPRTALEAYAAGVPVVSSRAGGTPDLVGADNDDWLFPPGDVDALTTTLARIIANGRDALPPESAFAPILAQTTEEIVVERYLALYRDTIKAVDQAAT